MSERTELKKTKLCWLIATMMLIISLSLLTGCGGTGNPISESLNNSQSKSESINPWTGPEEAYGNPETYSADIAGASPQGKPEDTASLAEYEVELPFTLDNPEIDFELPESTVEDEIILNPDGPGFLLEEDEFDLLLATPNPLSNDDWDLFFGSKSGQASRNGQGTSKKTWLYSSPYSQCLLEITVAYSWRKNHSTPAEVNYDESLYSYKTNNSGPAHYLDVRAVDFDDSVNCLDGPWDKTTKGYGLSVLEYKVAWRKIVGDCSGDEIEVEVDAESFYKSNLWANTWYGTFCPWARIANSYAVDRAQSVFNGFQLFDESGGAQSGDEVQTSIEFSLGGEFSTSEGAKGIVSIGKSETHVKDEGTAEDFVNGFGKSSSEAKSGFIYLNTGGKAFARHDARAAAQAQSVTKSAGVYLYVKAAGVGTGIYWIYGYDDSQKVEDTNNLIRPFFEARGISNFPPE